MSYIDFFHSDAITHTKNDVQLRVINGKIYNRGTAKLTISGTTSLSTDSNLSNSSGSLNINNARIVLNLKNIITNTTSFTFCAWIKHFSNSVASTFADIKKTTGNDYGCYYIDDHNGGKPSIWQKYGSYTTILSHQTVPTLNAWNHFAIVQNGNSLNIYLNGVKSSSTYSGYFATDGTSLNFYGKGISSNTGLNALVEDVYFTRKALWTGNFTPPTTYLPDNP